MEIPSPTYRSQVAAEVRAEMARKQVNATALVAATGIPHATLSRRLNGQAAFDVEELAAIAEHLGVPIAQFFPPLLVASV